MDRDPFTLSVEHMGVAIGLCALHAVWAARRIPRRGRGAVSATSRAAGRGRARMRDHVVGAHPNDATQTFDLRVRADDGTVLVVSVAAPRLIGWETWRAWLEQARDAVPGALALESEATVRVVSNSCLDLCDHGPNMIVQPEGTVYSHLTRELATAVYHGVMGDGPRRDDLELSEEEFRAARTKQ